MEFIDTHCHLYWDDFYRDRGDVIRRAREAGVRRCIIPATDVRTARQALDIAHAHDGVFVAVGVHPHDAAQAPVDVIAQLRTLATDPLVVAIGEIGLDYYYDFSAPHQQWSLLHSQLDLARSLDLPVIIHNRDADADVLRIIREHQDGTLRGQFHCFSSSAAFAEQVLAAGFHISFTGNVTYKKSTLDPTLSMVPDDRLLIETDAPFMAPLPWRGKRNEPMYIPHIATRFALTRHQDVQHIARITTRNAVALFHLDNRGLK